MDMLSIVIRDAGGMFRGRHIDRVAPRLQAAVCPARRTPSGSQPPGTRNMSKPNPINTSAAVDLVTTLMAIPGKSGHEREVAEAITTRPVSYTHLTLPTKA